MKKRPEIGSMDPCRAAKRLGYLSIAGHTPNIAIEQTAHWRRYCKKQNIPIIIIRGQDTRKGVHLSYEIPNLGTEYARPFTEDDMDQIMCPAHDPAFDEPARKKHLGGYGTTQGYIDDGACMPINDAHTLARMIVEIWRDRYETQPIQEGENTPMYGTVKLFKEGNLLAIQTDITNEVEFAARFATAITDYMTSDKYGGEGELKAYLQHFVEICCKLRGYKSTVKEQALYTVGEINPSSHTCVAVASDGREVVQSEQVS